MSYFAHEKELIDEGFEIGQNVMIFPKVILEKIVKFKIIYRFTRLSIAKIKSFQETLKNNISGISINFSYLIIFKTINLT